MVSIYVQPTSLAIDKYPTPDKERAQLLWVAHMNGLKAQAEEVVLRCDRIFEVICVWRRNLTVPK